MRVIVPSMVSWQLSKLRIGRKLKIVFVQIKNCICPSRKCICAKPHLARSQVGCTLNTLQSPHWTQSQWTWLLQKSVSRIIPIIYNIALCREFLKTLQAAVSGDGRGEGGRECHLNDEDEQNRVRNPFLTEESSLRNSH